jgi:hypothetical protein
MKFPSFRRSFPLALASALASAALAAPPSTAGREPSEGGTVAAGQPCEGVAVARVHGHKFWCKDGTWQTTPPAATPDTASKKPKKCDFTCRTDRKTGIEICKGNGPQCNGKTPPGW